MTALALLPGEVGAHPFVRRTDPRASATLAESPEQVRIWFDGPVETMFLELRVEAEDKRRVDNKDAHRSPDNDTLVEVGLPRLPPGDTACSGAWWRGTGIAGKGASRSW